MARFAVTPLRNAPSNLPSALLSCIRGALLLGCLTTILPIASLGQSQNSKPASGGSKVASHVPIPSAHEQFAPYWTTEAGWRSELQLRNNLAAGNLTVTPVLRAADGTEFPLSPVTIAPNEIKSVDVSDAVSKTAPQLMSAYGSVVFRYTSVAMRNLYAAVMVFDSGHPLAFHFDAFVQATDYDAGSREGIWWLPNATAKDYFLLTNNSPQPLQATLTLFDAKGKSSAQQIALQPKTTLRNSVREMVQKAGFTGAYGGFKIDLKSKVGSLDTAYLLFDEEVGFSALMKTFDRNPQGKIAQHLGIPEVKTWTTRAPMLALASPDPGLGFPQGTVLQPEIFVRNTTAAPVAADLRFNWRSDANSGSAVGPTLQLAPYETRLVDVAALQKNQVIPVEAHWASVELASSGRPNDIMATAASYDGTLRYGTQTPFNDQLTYHWEGGEWHVDSTHNSIITAGNGGSIAVKAQLTIYYDGGKKRYDLEQQLKPHEQMWVDVGKLIHEQVPDKAGVVLPSDLTMGSYELQDLTDRGIGNLFEGRVILDKTFGHVAYGCAMCCGYEDPYLYWDPIGVIMGLEGDQDVWAHDSCAGVFDSVLGDIIDATWGTGNHAIATAQGHVITGVAPGNTTNFVQATLRFGGPAAKNCPEDPINPSGSANVLPAISPGQGLIGTTINVTITGSGFGATPTVNAGTGITFTYNSRSDTSITASFAVASNAPAGYNSVVVTTTAGTALPAVNFYVQIPTHIQLYNQPPEAPGGRGPVISVVNGTIYKLDGSVFATNQCGVYENFLFDIADQQGTQIINGTVYVTEVFSNITNPPGPTPSTNFAVNLASQGYEDLHARSHTYPTCLAYNENQAYNLTWTVKVGSVSATAYPAATSVYITKGNFNGNLNVTLTVTTP